MKRKLFLLLLFFVVVVLLLLSSCTQTGIYTDPGKYRHKGLHYKISNDGLRLDYQSSEGQKTTVLFNDPETLKDFLIEDLIGMD